MSLDAAAEKAWRAFARHAERCGRCGGAAPNPEAAAPADLCRIGRALRRSWADLEMSAAEVAALAARRAAVCVPPLLDPASSNGRRPAFEAGDPGSRPGAGGAAEEAGA